MGTPNRTWRTNRLKNKLTADVLNEAYTRLGSCRAVGRELGCDSATVKRYMRDFGLEVKSQIRYSCDECFFADDNEKSYYWAGFLAADGCVKTRKSSSGKTRHQVALALSSKDTQHVKLFKENLNANHKIHIFTVKNAHRGVGWNDSQKAEFTIESKQMFDSLAKFNIVPRKSLIYTFPEWLIDHELVHHFMRGYFDGDGSWYWQRFETKKDQLMFALRGTTEFLTVFRTILERECDLPKRDKPIRVNNGIGVLEYGGNGVCGKIVEYLYRDASIHLERKRKATNGK